MTENVIETWVGLARGDEEIELRDVSPEGWRDETGTYYCLTRMGGTMARNVPMGKSTDEKRSRRSRTETRFAVTSLSKLSPARFCRVTLVSSSWAESARRNRSCHTTSVVFSSLTIAGKFTRFVAGCESST
jgi:hypothetical protein